MSKKSAKNQEQYLIQMRRKSVAELWFSGESVEKMAEVWKCDRSTIYNDMQWIENNADDMMRNYIVKTVPHIINRSLYQIDFANREAMKVLKESKNNKEKIAAALAVSKTAKDVIDIVTNNDDFVNAALELDESLQKEAEDYLSNGVSEGSTETEAETEDANRKF